jgi:hypothetical protein
MTKNFGKQLRTGYFSFLSALTAYLQAQSVVENSFPPERRRRERKCHKFAYIFLD